MRCKELQIWPITMLSVYINSDSTIGLIMGIAGKEYSLHKMRGLGREERK